jgi:hypothetical protein
VSQLVTADPANDGFGTAYIRVIGNVEQAFNCMRNEPGGYFRVPSEWTGKKVDGRRPRLEIFDEINFLVFGSGAAFWVGSSRHIRFNPESLTYQLLAGNKQSNGGEGGIRSRHF